MRSIILTSAALLCATTILSGCSTSPAQTGDAAPAKAAHHIAVIDVSVSTALAGDEAVSRAIVSRIGDDMQRDARLGDSFSVYEAGTSDAERMVGHPTIRSGYKLRLPAARKQLDSQLQEIVARLHAHGGDTATHLSEALETIHPVCASGQDTITLATDGVEESEAYSVAKALTAGKPVHLPSPSAGKYLTGCRVRLIGFGLTIDPSAERPQLLTAKSLAALRQGWTEYLQMAGVRPDAMEFVSAL